MSSSLVSGASAQAPTADASHSIVSPMQALAHLQDLTSQLQHKLGGLVQKSGSLAKDDKDDATGLEAALESADSPLAQAKLLVTAAYTIHSLVFIFLRTQGSDPAGHAVRSELARPAGHGAVFSEGQKGITRGCTQGNK
ncbi:hypothetical protein CAUPRSCDRAFT_10309 [Caulochytrium protostelioides]|uniref:Exosome complex protein n=1 Tax=Caulochytrium protostelioides TaxID=1555241 RepID=A0A4P9X047_9FUNG|nr:hypothetical protein CAUPRSCDRAFT_10309 [Caulochytrium protostelioides]